MRVILNSCPRGKSLQSIWFLKIQASSGHTATGARRGSRRRSVTSALPVAKCDHLAWNPRPDFSDDKLSITEAGSVAQSVGPPPALLFKPSRVDNSRCPDRYSLGSHT